ncbi:MAG: ABC transporter permease, partial [Sphaerochaetaceae bacterium]
MVISKIAYRYAFSKGNRHRSASLVIMVGLAIGMAALITLLALMNNLQHDLLEQVKSIESFHLQLSVASEEGELEAIKGAIKATAGVESTFAFVNTQVMVANPSNQNSSTGRLRVVDPAIWESANPFSDHLFLIAGNYPEGAEEIALSNAMAQSLKCRVGEELNVTLLVPGRTAPLAPATLKFRVSAIYSTSLREFDESTLLTSSEQLLKRLGLKRTTFGIFLKEGSVDKSHNVITELTKRVPEATIMSWQQLNSAFYSALTLEKIMMYLFLSFMFFILGVNMKS